MLTAKKVKDQREARRIMCYMFGTTSHGKDLLLWTKRLKHNTSILSTTKFA